MLNKPIGKLVLYTKHTKSRKTNVQKTAKDVDTTISSNKSKRLQLRTSEWVASYPNVVKLE